MGRWNRGGFCSVELCKVTLARLLDGKKLLAGVEVPGESILDSADPGVARCPSFVLQTNGELRRAGDEPKHPVDHLLFRPLSSVYGATRTLGRGEGDARDREPVRMIS